MTTMHEQITNVVSRKRGCAPQQIDIGQVITDNADGDQASVPCRFRQSTGCCTSGTGEGFAGHKADQCVGQVIQALLVTSTIGKNVQVWLGNFRIIYSQPVGCIIGSL